MLSVRSLLMAAVASAGVAHAQAAPADAGAGRPMPGEVMTYDVTLSPFGKVGTGSLRVVGRDTVRGVEAFRLRMDIKGGLLFAKVDDTMESWVDPEPFHSVRFYQDQHEYKYKRERTIDFYPTQMRWAESSGKTGDLGSATPLDDISFLYFARQLPLEVGKTYTLNRYFQPDGNPVTLQVLRRETVSVPAGTFETIVVKPIIQTNGLFGRGGKAEVYFTDDDQRILVQLKSDVPFIGSLNLKLTDYMPGARPMAPEAADIAGSTTGS